MRNRIKSDLTELMLIPGLSGHEDRVRRAIAAKLDAAGIARRTDVLGNLIATIDGHPDAPPVMLFAHMDQLGFVVRKIEDDGLIRVERLGGVPERALASQMVVLCGRVGLDVPGVIANKAHHATTPDEKYQVVHAPDLVIDTGLGSRERADEYGIEIGTPVVYRPSATDMGADRLSGTAIDDRAGCAVLLEVARTLQDRANGGRDDGPTVHIVFAVQEEFNLRGAVVAAQSLHPKIAIQVDLMLATDTPDMADRGDMVLGRGPGMSLYSFHGRGTLNGVIPHPAMIALMSASAQSEGIPLQRSAQSGILTDLSYVQLVDSGVASIDVGFPMRYSHSSAELCDLNDLEALARVLIRAMHEVSPDFSLDRDAWLT